MGLISAIKYVWDNKTEINNLVTKEREEEAARKLVDDSDIEILADLKLKLCKYHKGTAYNAVLKRECDYCTLMNVFKASAKRHDSFGNPIVKTAVDKEIKPHHEQSYRRLRKRSLI